LPEEAKEEVSNGGSMSVAHQFRDGMTFRVNSLFQNTEFRYLFSIAAVASVFALRIWLIPLTGTGAPYVLFFTAVLVTSLFAGVGPAICAVLLSMPLGAYTFVVGAGYSIVQASFQSLVFAVDGIVAIYLTFLTRKAARSLQDTNRQLRESEQRYRALFDSIDEGFCVVEVLFDDADNALDYRFLEVNRVFEKQTGISNAVGRRMREIAPAHEEHWFQIYGQIALTGESRRFENPAHALGRFYDVYAFRLGRPEQRQVAILFNDITERKRVEEALQESEERFRLTIDEAPIGMALVALDGRFVRVNRALCEIVGYGSTELTGLTFQAITHPDDRDADLALLDQLARGEIPRYQLGKRYIRKDGTIVDIQLSTSILRSREGAPLYYIAQIEEVTDRKRAEAALRDSERRLSLALDSAQMGMWDLDLLTDTSVRSLRHDQIFGYSVAVPTWGVAVFMTHVVPEDREVAKHAFEKAFVSDNFDMECRIFWADESIHWISAKGRVYRNPKGDPVRMMGTVVDVTEQKRAEEALQRSEREFRELAESMPQIVWATRADGRNIYFNQQWVDYTGLTLEESSGDGWITPFHPDDRQRAWDAWKRATQDRETYSLECRLRRADGAYRWWLIRGVPLLSANGEINKWFGTCTDIEQIKVAEQRLKESEAKFSGIVSISADAIISIDEEQRITIFNDGAEKIFGYSKAEAIGSPLGNLIPERLREIYRQHVEGFASGAATARRMGGRLTTITGLRKNGEEFPGEGTISKLEVGDKTIVTVALRDITERKRVEKELKDANAFLDAIIENIPLMLFIKESQSLQFVRLNRAGEDLLGWPRQRFIGKSDYDFWPQAQAEFFVEKDRETLKRATIVDISEEPIQTRHQGVRILHTKKVPILDTAGNPIYLLGISEDITERSRIEKEQRFLAEASVLLSASLDQEQTLATVARLAVQNVADWCAVDVIEEQGQLRRLKVASSDPAKAALCVVLEQMPPDRDLPHLMRSVIESKRPIVVEQVTSEYLESLGQGPEHLQALLATGVTSFVAVPLLMRGQPLGALLLGSSTMSRVFGHGDLRLAEALADRAAVAIENARHYRSSVNATQLRDQVLGIVAHDLRNPLSTILMQTSALKRQGPKLERRSEKPMDVIHRAATRMNRLIQDLLDVAVMEAGQLTINRARLSAGGLIAEVVDMQRPLASSSSLEIRVEVDPDVAEVWGDRDRLIQVFENLIGNAIKFTQAGGRITAGATSRDDEVVFWVADTGGGIPSENLPRVFDRFWTATRTGRQGAGLGLPITKGIVEAHGGRIWVESTVGSGSTFFFTIPRISAAEERLPDRHRRDRVA
jgi:PAS domain S-box-containing protein